MDATLNSEPVWGMPVRIGSRCCRLGGIGVVRLLIDWDDASDEISPAGCNPLCDGRYIPLVSWALQPDSTRPRDETQRGRDSFSLRVVLGGGVASASESTVGVVPPATIAA